MGMVSNIGRIVPIYRGDYSNTVRYSSLDQVRWNHGDIYIVKFSKDPPLGTPPDNTAYWDPVFTIGSEVKGYRDDVIGVFNNVENITATLRAQIESIDSYYGDITNKHNTVVDAVALFNKKFIGVSATPPTIDKNGNTLGADNIGAWYFNSTDNYGYTWTGTNWENLTKSANYDASKLTGTLPIATFPFPVGTYGKTLVALDNRNAAINSLAIKYSELVNRPTIVADLAISDFNEVVQDIVGALVVSGSNINAVYSDENNRLTVSSTATASTLSFTPASGVLATTIQGAVAELATKLNTNTDAVATKMTKSVYDPLNKQANVFDRASHTGTQAISTIANLDSVLSGKAQNSVNISATGLALGGGTLQNNLTIDVPIASPSQAIDGSSNILAMTPAATKSAILSYTSNSSDRNETVFPIGHTVLVANVTNGIRNAAISQIRLSTDNENEYVATGTGALLVGIWRMRGRSGTGTQCERVM